MGSGFPDLPVREIDIVLKEQAIASLSFIRPTYPAPRVLFSSLKALALALQ